MNTIPNSDVDRLGVVFDEGSLVADAGLLVAGVLMSRLGLERLLDETVRLGGRGGGALPGRKVLTLVASMLVGGSHIDHADRLRDSGDLLPHWGGGQGSGEKVAGVASRRPSWPEGKGGSPGTRTPNLRVKSPLLCQLS